MINNENNESSTINLNYSINDYENADVIKGYVDGNINDLRSVLNNLQYIQADRISPRSSYPQAGTFNRESGWLGNNGEYTIDFINQNENFLVSENRSMKDQYSSIDSAFRNAIAPTLQLNDQISAWLQEISPGAQIATSNIDNIDATTLSFKYKTKSQVISSERRPVNVSVS